MNPGADSPRRADIMLVDDQPANLKLLSEMLGGAGYDVRPFPAGRLAIQAALRQPPDLILLDINMPEMDGFAFLVAYTTLRTALPQPAPVVMLTSSSEPSDRERAMAVPGVAG